MASSARDSLLEVRSTFLSQILAVKKFIRDLGEKLFIAYIR